MRLKNPNRSVLVVLAAAAIAVFLVVFPQIALAGGGDVRYYCGPVGLLPKHSQMVLTYFVYVLPLSMVCGWTEWVIVVYRRCGIWRMPVAMAIIATILNGLWAWVLLVTVSETKTVYESVVFPCGGWVQILAGPSFCSQKFQNRRK